MTTREREREGGCKILIVTPDGLQARMAGLAIRAWHMAAVLSSEHDVELASTVGCGLEHPDFSVRHVDDAELRALADWADIVVIQGDILARHPWLRASTRVLVADIYDPVHLEVLEQTRGETAAARRASARATVDVLNERFDPS